jgi:molybdopterin molybdotransferase
MLPEGADTVVMQEYATTNEASMRYTDDKLKQGGNVRRTGEQFKRGDVIVPAGTHITEPVIGLLASAGMVRYKVSRQPTVYVVTTGGEFTSDQPPKPGKIFSSNDVMLHAALQRAGARVFTERTLDEATLLRASLEKAAAVGDVIITTGGASVGDHDLMRPVLEKLGAEIHFHGVSQKPGKPMLFATLSGKPVFALPGNPRAVMVLFWEYVLPFLRAMQGALRPQLKSDEFPIAHAVNVKGERAEFRAAQVKSGKVTLLADEGSHMLSSLIDADAIAYLPAGRRAWKEGEPIEVHYLPQ